MSARTNDPDLPGAGEAPGARRPAPEECGPYYASYFPLVPEGDIVATLRQQGEEHARFFGGLPLERHDHRYAPGKWSVKEVLGHLIDAEWVFSYRALRFARGDATPLPGMDQDVFVAGGRFAQRTMESLLLEFFHLRAATAAMAASFDQETLGRTGTASGAHFTVRSLLYFLAGHERHHVGVVRERYL